jgi:hypothetical protein
MIIDRFACDYETLARMAQGEQRAIARAEDDGEYTPISDARDYALAVEAARRDNAQKLLQFKDDAFHACVSIVAQMAVTRGLTDAKRAQIQQALIALVEAIK